MIQIQNVNYKYKNGYNALKNINLTIQNGEFVAIVGKNGSGKSTLSRLVTGLKLPSIGDVVVNDINTKSKKGFLSLRKNISIVFQNPENQIVFDRVYDDIAFALENLGIPKDEIKPRVEKALQEVNMQNYIHSSSYELSLGQKQRIAIASALAVNSKTIVLDEPTSMIDPTGKKDIYRIVKDLNNKDYTIIYITNAIDEILLADRIVVLEDGEIKREILKDELLDKVHLLKEAGLEIPEMINLVLRLKEKNINLGNFSSYSADEIVSRILEVLNLKNN